MTDEQKKATGEAEATEQAMLNLLDSVDSKLVREYMGTALGVYHLGPNLEVISAYLQARSIPRQESILERQEKALQRQEQTLAGIRELTEKQEAILERQEKALIEQNKMVKDSLASSTRFGKLAIRLSIGSVILSVCLGLAAILLSYAAYRSSNEWQAKQIPLIEKVVDTTDKLVGD